MRIIGERPRSDPLPESPSPEAPSTQRAKGTAGAFSRVLQGLGRSVDGGEALVAQASHGSLGGLDSAQLIALQAGIYRYSEAVDLLAKLVDRTATAVKTVVSPH
jgi:hypothetical protein